MCQKGTFAKIYPVAFKLVPPEILQVWKRDAASSGTENRPGTITNITAWPQYFLYLSLQLISQANMTQGCQITNAYLQ